MDITPYGDTILKQYPAVASLINDLYDNLTDTEMGVTIAYPYVTLRFRDEEDRLQSVTMVIVEVRNGEPEPEPEDK